MDTDQSSFKIAGSRSKAKSSKKIFYRSQTQGRTMLPNLLPSQSTLSLRIHVQWNRPHFWLSSNVPDPHSLRSETCNPVSESTSGSVIIWSVTSGFVMTWLDSEVSLKIRDHRRKCIKTKHFWHKKDLGQKWRMQIQNVLQDWINPNPDGY